MRTLDLEMEGTLVKGEGVSRDGTKVLSLEFSRNAQQPLRTVC